MQDEDLIHMLKMVQYEAIDSGKRTHTEYGLLLSLPHGFCKAGICYSWIQYEKICAVSSDHFPQICTEQNEHNRVCLMANNSDLHHGHS